jgi:predicted Zn-dependent peptidase
VGSLDESLLDSIIYQLRIIQPDRRKQKSSTVIISQNELSEHVERPNSIQSSLRLGKRIINRNHKDYPALVLLNHIFGGYFGSRLMKNIREDKGLTYGIHSSISNLKHDAFFVIGADVNRINKDIAIAEIRKELDTLRNKIVGGQELQTAKSHLLGSLQLEIANPFSVIDKIKTIHLIGLDENFYNDLFVEILNVDETAIQRVALEHLSDSLVEVAVG